jgi:hypothetical protein
MWDFPDFYVNNYKWLAEMVEAPEFFFEQK